MKLKTKVFTMNALLIIALLGMGMVSIFVFQEVNKAWQGYQERIVTKINYVTFLRAQMGYGGVIHNFKNYVLRGEKEYLGHFNRHKQRISDIIKGYHALGNLTLLEVESLDLLSDMINRYQVAVNKTEILWKGKSSTEVYNKIRYVENMRSEMGYGGAIHNFKNYVLRREEQYRKNFEIKNRGVMNSINGYRAIGNLSEAEDAALTKLDEMTAEYQIAVDEMETMVAQGASVSKIDQNIKIDDKPYLAAMDQLAEELHFATEIRRDIDSQIMIDDEPFIEALVVLSRELSRASVQQTEKLTSLINLGSVFIMTLGFITLITAVFFGVIISISIGKQFQVLITRIKSIDETKELDVELPITKDEFGVVAESFNHMIESLKNAQSELDSKTKELEINLQTSELQNKLLEDTKKATLNLLEDLEESKKVIETERKELDEKTKDLQKVNRELDSFVYTASHDLRAPLRGISSFATFLEEDYKNKFDAQGKDYLEEIRKGAERMSSLIEDLLTLSRISRIKNPFEQTDIGKLVESVLERIQFDIKESKVKLIIPEDLPSIKCDRIKMAEVFLNLINNGIKFSSKNNKEKPIVELGWKDKRDHHEFFVKDNGIGIDKKYHDQIFGVFKRLHTSQEYEGTGAGLSIIKRIIEDHEGELWVESELGKGACFYFTIPKELTGERKKLGEILVEDGVVTKEKIEEVLKKQQKDGDPPEYKGDIRGD